MSRRRFLGSAAALPLMAASGASRAGAAGKAQRKPNLVWIWCDNLAYGDLSCYGNKRIETPVVDKMAEDGVRFMQHYVAHTVCSPSRVALLTGRQPFRTGIVDVLRPDCPAGIPDDEITLGDALRAEGYATAAFGKWHLGDRREFLPRQHGFDHYYGLPYSMDMLPTVLYRENEIVEELPGDTVQNITERLIDDAISFVESNQEKPFFIYFSHTIPHPPLNIPPAYRHEGRTVYDDALEYMDEQTGRLLAAIDKLGLAEDTLVMFSSDNGPMGKYGDTAGLRGRIRDSREGGVRVPMVARWPGKIPAGRAVDSPTIAYDIFPTFVHLAGGQVPDDRAYDGQDIWALLSGDGDFERQQPFYWVYLDNVTAVRDGKWKLHVGHRDKALDPPELYDVEADPYEANLLNDEEPEVLARMLKQVEAYQARVPKVWSLQYPVRAADKLPSGIRRK